MDVLHLVVALREGIFADCVCYHRCICCRERRSGCVTLAK
jgi:hypothetical protein